MSFLRKQESRLLMPSKSPSPGLAEGQASLSRQGRGQLLHPAKMLRKKSNIFADWRGPLVARYIPSPCRGRGLG